MNKTQHYQLNQWDPEDRILRLDFNADNAATEAALKENADAITAEASARTAADASIRTDFVAADTAVRSEFAAADTKIRTDFAAADASVRSEFAAADTKIRTDFAAADTKIRTDFAAADTTIKNSVTTEATTRANQDAAIRSEFAAADATLRSENMMVKLYSTTTTAASTQINISLSGLKVTQYNEIIVLARINYPSSSNKYLYMRVNNLSSAIYATGSSSYANYAIQTVPMTNWSNTYISAMQRITLVFNEAQLFGFCEAIGSSGGTKGFHIPSASLSPSSVTTLNFTSSDGSISIPAGAKFTIYGVK